MNSTSTLVLKSRLVRFLQPRELYNLCQMFPVAACKAVQSVLKDSTDSMEEAVEAKGHAAFPTLDTVRVGLQAVMRLTSSLKWPLKQKYQQHSGSSVVCP